MAEVEVTLSSDSFKRTEARLEEWAEERGRVTAHLRIPVLSSMSTMVDYLHREETKRQVVRSEAPKRKQRKAKRQVRVYRTRVCTNCEKIYCAAECPACHQPPPLVSARGTATMSMREQDRVGFTSSVAEIDKIISNLPGRHKSAIFRGYMYRQPDRIAARELDMPRESFTWLRERAVIMIAEKLAERRVAGI